jgi:hypothetical protein
MTDRSRHLDGGLLSDYYYARRGDAAPDLAAAQHLEECRDCRERYGELARVLDLVRTEGDAEVDACFPPDRLRQQQQQILRRLAHLGEAARIIRFPTIGARSGRSGTRITAPWLAAAAAAGLFVGLALGGAFFDVGSAPARPPGSSASRGLIAVAPSPRPLAPPTAPLVIRDTVDDAEFMSDLEAALQYPRTRELLPFDALTPHALEISTLR